MKPVFAFLLLCSQCSAALLLETNHRGRSLWSYAWLLLFCTVVSNLRSDAQAVELIAVSTFDDMVYRIDATGKPTALNTGLAFQSRPHGVAVDALGNVFIATVGEDAIRRVAANGQGNSNFYTFDSLYDNPEAVAFGSDGNLYVAGTIDYPLIQEPNWLYRITPSGVGTPFAPIGPAENLGVTVDRVGNVFVTDFAISGDDFWSEVWKVTPEGQSARIARFQARATGITMAPDGQSLLVADNWYDRLLLVSADGNVETHATVTDPWSVAVAGDDVFVGTFTSILRLSADGTQSTIATGFQEVRGLAIYVPPAINADYNANGSVDAGDYVLWRDRIGGTLSLPNDATPGVDIGDYDVWRANYGKSAPLSSSGALVGQSVPEMDNLEAFFVLIAALLLIRYARQVGQVRS